MMRRAQIITAVLVVVLIASFGFGAVFVVLGAIAAAWVLGVLALPIIVWATMRIAERPPGQSIAHDDPGIPDVVRAALTTQHDALVSLGFEPRGLARIAPSPRSSAWLGLFVHPAASAGALAWVLATHRRDRTVVQSTDVELDIHYPDGTALELSTVAGYSPGLELLPGVVRQMPHVRAPGRLFQYFVALAARYERDSGLRREERVPVAHEATPLTVYYDQLAATLAPRHRAGLLKPATDAGVWRPTWRLAVKVAAASVSPGLEFMKRRIMSRGQRLQRELDGDPTTTLAERIGHRNGFLMMAVAVVLIPLTVMHSIVGSSMAVVGLVAAWSLGSRRGAEPGWRTLFSGGLAAIVLLAVPMTVLEYLVSPAAGAAAVLPFVQLYAIPIALLTIASVLLIEGFRAAAT